jgi:hypothetical protein
MTSLKNEGPAPAGQEGLSTGNLTGKPGLGDDVQDEKEVHLAKRAPCFVEPQIWERSGSIQIQGNIQAKPIITEQSLGLMQCIRCGQNVVVMDAGRVNIGEDLEGGNNGKTQVNPETRIRDEFAIPETPPVGYVVLGIFSGADGIPKERMTLIKKPSSLFWYFFWTIVRLRGIGWLFSLKDVKRFAIYKVSK